MFMTINFEYLGGSQLPEKGVRLQREREVGQRRGAEGSWLPELLLLQGGEQLQLVLLEVEQLEEGPHPLSLMQSR